MAVSYLSKVYESNPYVLPVDLGLLAKVNQYKQGLFYQNASALKQQYSALKNSDILNPEQKAVLDQKYNNLANSVTSWGGVDYSDMGIVNQMEGMAASIYSDPTVLNGIASTKKIRTLMGNYEKMKTDPKLMKYYNPGNEQWDMQATNEYISGGANATYNGSTAPTIYKGNPYTRLTETIKKLKPNIETYFDATNNPYFIEKTTNSVLDPSKVLAEMEGSIDADTMNQIKIDAWYNMRGVDNTKLEQMYTQNHENKINAYGDLLTKYNKNLEVATTNEQKTQIKVEIAKVNNLIAQQNSTYNIADFRKKVNTKEGNIDVKAGVYLNKLFDDGIKANSYQQVQRSLQVNIEQIQKDKRELGLMQMQNARDIAMLRGKGKGKGTGVGADGQPLLFGDIEYNTQTLEELKDKEQLTIGKLKLDTAEKEVELSKLLNEFAINNANFVTEAADKKNYLGLGDTDKLKRRLGEIAILDQKEGLSIEDLKLYMNSTTLKPNDKEKEFFQKSINLFEGAAKGDFSELANTTISKSEFKNIYQQYADKQDRIEGNNALLQKTKEQALENFKAQKNISAAEAEVLKKYIENPMQYKKNVSTGSYQGGNLGLGSVQQTTKPVFFDKKVEDIVRKAGLVNVQTADNAIDLINEQNKLLKDDSYRQNYYSMPLNYKELNKDSSQFQSLAATKIIGADVETINLISISQVPTSSEQYKTTPWSLKVQYKNSKGTIVTQDVYLNNQQANALGVDANTRMDLETTLLRKGELTPRFETNEVWSDAGVFKYQVVRPSGNSGQIQVLIKNDNGSDIKLSKWQDQNGNFNNFSNATQAMEVMKGIINNAHNVFNNRQAFLQQLATLQSK